MSLVYEIDRFCDEHLDEEYKVVCRVMAVNVCQKGSPVLRGKVQSWTAGIVYTVGRVNFLTDPSQSPHMKSKVIAKAIGTSVGTMQSKANLIANALDVSAMDPIWTLPSRLDDNLLVWLLEINGMYVDIRNEPREQQVIAFQQGLIPYIPADHDGAGQSGLKLNGVEPGDTELNNRTQARNEPPSSDHPHLKLVGSEVLHLLELEVEILDGPMSKSFARKNRAIIRLIQIRSDQTLQDFHNAIFKAFDRFEEHFMNSRSAAQRLWTQTPNAMSCQWRSMTFLMTNTQQAMSPRPRWARSI